MKPPKRGVVLAEGEVTGHSHVAVADDAIGLYEKDGIVGVDLPSGSDVKHEEHGTIRVPPGTYQVSRQREIDPDTDEIRRVAD